MVNGNDIASEQQEVTLQARELAEKAFDELKYTVQLATEYWRLVDKHYEELESHANDLAEDANILEQQVIPLEQQKAAADLIAEARRLKRALTRAAFPLKRALTEAQQQVHQQQQVQPNVNTTTVIEKKSSALKLPPIKLPTFDGTIENYRGFINALHDTLNSEKDITDVKKWMVLKGQLEGRAFELIQDLPIAPESYEVALELLEDTYGSTRKATVNLYQKIQALPYAMNSDESLRTTHARLEGILKSLEHLGVDVEGNDFIRSVVLGKYPSEIINQLLVTDSTSLKEFREKIGQYIRSRECGIRITPLPPKQNNSLENKNRPRFENRPNKPSAPVASTTQGSNSNETIDAHIKMSDTKKPKRQPPKGSKCPFCGACHWADECSTYKTVAQRTARLQNHCNRCLRLKHDGSACPKIHQCIYCAGDHNRALCPTQFVESKILMTREIEIPDVIKEKEATPLITIKIKAGNRSSKKWAKIRSLLDTAAERSLITHDLVKKLCLKHTGRQTYFSGAGGVSLQSEAAPSVKIYLFPPNSKPIEIEAFVVDKICDEVAVTNVDNFKQRYPQYANLEMPSEGNGEQVGLLLGAKALLPILTLQKSIYVGPAAQLLSTKFGWAIFGGFDDADEPEFKSNAAIHLIECDPIKLMSDLDLVGMSELTSGEIENEEEALKRFYETIKYIDKRYQVTWPWRILPPEITDNFGLAWGRLKSLHKKLSANRDLLIAYDRIIREQVEMDVVEPVPRTEKTNGVIHYIAHQAVIRIGKNTPVRIVYDASAPAGPGGKSLNDNILKGANWVDQIPSLLMRFRRYLVAATADIEKAFHQIAIAPEDRDAVRFLWLRNPSRPPTSDNILVYRFKRVAFGIVASPFLLYATIRYHLKQHPHVYAPIVEKDLYADNLVTSLPTGTETNDFYKIVKSSFAHMSMNLTKWATNNKILRALIQKGDAETELVTSVLGLIWDTEADSFRLKTPPITTDNTTPVTKRRALKEMASVYDPLGFVMPIVLLARLFIRRLWQQNLKWDNQIDEKQANEWRQLRIILLDVSKFCIPRIYGTSGFDSPKAEYELHIFADASIEAYGLVAYLRIVYPDNTGEVSFVASKSRLTPKTKLSVPRLELLAAVTACRFATYTKNSLQTDAELEIFFWGDSKCVLAWIHSKRILPTVVEKAVRQIRSHKITAFSYVPTESNPADCVTRGATYQQLKQTNWWNGPSWLPNAETWPHQAEIQQHTELAHELETENQRILLTRCNVQQKIKISLEDIEGSPFDLNPNDFSQLNALLKRTAFCAETLRRFDKKKLSQKFSSAQPYTKNFKFCTNLWLQWDQNRAYSTTEQKSNVAYLRNLKVTRKEDGLLHCYTRLHNAQIQPSTYEPILLVKNSAFTKLLIMHIHQNNMHAGTSHTLAILRKSYWLPHGRRTIFKTIKSNCQACNNYEAQPYRHPDMPQLPQFRIQKTEGPFCHVGMDVFGPFKIRIGPYKDSPIEKRWVIIFTCLVIRAIHLELLQDLTPEKFLHAFRRFVGRRGVPETVVCDNAPQFYVIKGIFQTLWQSIQSDQQATSYFTTKNINWKFIPPSSPWMGGVYERLIKIIKDSFFKTYSTAVLNEEQFATTLIELEAIINSRPITYVDQNQDTPVISPNDFLFVKYPAIPLSFEKESSPNAVLWKNTQNYLNIFWKLWSEQYLLSLRERQDIMPTGRTDNLIPIKEGDVVLMTDLSAKKIMWRRAVVEKLLPSADGQIRTAQIKVANGGRLLRPISKLASIKVFTDVSDAPQLNATAAAIILPGSEGAQAISQSDTVTE